MDRQPVRVVCSPAFSGLNGVIRPSVTPLSPLNAFAAGEWRPAGGTGSWVGCCVSCQGRGCRRVLGEGHPLTLASATNLASGLRALGEHERARELDDWIRAQREQ